MYKNSIKFGQPIPKLPAFLYCLEGLMMTSSEIFKLSKLLIGKEIRHVLYLNFYRNLMLFPLVPSDFENSQKNICSGRPPDDVI